MQSQEQKDALTEAYRRVNSGKHSYSPEQVDAIKTLAERWGVSTPPTAKPDPNKAIKDRQAAKYPTAAEQGGKPGAVAPQPEESTQDMTAAELSDYNVRHLVSKVGGAAKNIATSLSEPAARAINTSVSGVGGKVGLRDTAPQASPLSAAVGFASGASKLVTGPLHVAHGLYEGDQAEAEQGTSDFITEGIPAAMAVKGILHAVPHEGVFSRTPPNLLKRVLPNVELEHLQRAGHDLKAAEGVTGKTITDVPSALAAEEHQATAINERVRAILDPQRDVVVPGSRAKFIDTQMKAIPDDIRLHDPAKYQSIVQDLQSQAALPDMTIGDINDARVSANKLRRTYYNSKLGAQLAKDEQLNAAMLAGRDAASHQLLSEAVDTVGLGGATEIKNLTQRLGSLIKVKEGLQGLANPAELQAGTPIATRFGQQVSNLGAKARFKTGAFDNSLSINSDIANAMRRWKGQPADFQMIGSGAPKGQAPGGGSPAFARPKNVTPPPQPTLPGGPTTLAGAQSDLLPSGGPGVLNAPDTAPQPYQPGMAPMDEVPRRKIWSQAAPQAPAGQMDVPSDPRPLLSDTHDPSQLPTEMSAEGYAQAQRQKGMWADAAPAKPPGQMDLQQGLAPDLYGIKAPDGPTPPQQQLRFGNGPGVDQSAPPVEGQQSFSFPKTDRENWLEEYFKQHPETAPRARRF